LALVLLLVWLGLLGGGFYSKTGNQQHRLETLNGQLKAMLSLNDPENVAAVTRAVARLQDQVEKLKKEHRTLARFANYHYDTLDLFKQIADAMKTYPNLTVDSVSFNGDRFVMTGTTPNYTDSEGLKTALADLPRFKGRTTKITHTRAAQVIQYRLSIER
jgi:Tfp pilus assembly protein PilN